MKKTCILILTFAPLIGLANNCNISRFHWDCDIPLYAKPNHHAHSLVYCGNIPVYVTKRDYLNLVSYQRANINMTMTVNDEYFDSPCIPARL